jgi:hypothetical protein
MTFNDELTMRCVRMALESAEEDAKRLEDERQRLLVLDVFRHARIALRSYEKRARAAVVLVIAFLLIAPPATADEAPAPPRPANEACACPVNGAVQGETIEARVERLAMQLRLAKAEALVNRKRRK